MRITSTLHALAWIAAESISVTLARDPKSGALSAKVKNHGCGRCGGTGNTGIYWVEDGVCFACRGSGGDKSTNYTPIKVWASKTKSARNAAEKRRKKREARAAEVEAKRLEGERKWCRENGHGDITFAELNVKREAEREAKRLAAEPVPSGRVEFEGTILSVKWKESFYGGGFKMLVESTEGWKVWGSRPESMSDLESGATVTMRATIEASDDDEKFGFFKRPHLVKAAASAA